MNIKESPKYIDCTDAIKYHLCSISLHSGISGRLCILVGEKCITGSMFGIPDITGLDYTTILSTVKFSSCLKAVQ